MTDVDPIHIAGFNAANFFINLVVAGFIVLIINFTAKIIKKNETNGSS